MRFIVQVDDQTLSAEVEERGARFVVIVGEETFEVDAREFREGTYSLLIDGVSYLADVKEEHGQMVVEIGGETSRLRVEEALRARLRGQLAPETWRGGQVVRAPMPGKVVSVLVSVGEPVKAGTALMIIEAMKMENELRAAVFGEVKELRVTPGEAVTAGQVLMVIE